MLITGTSTKRHPLIKSAIKVGALKIPFGLFVAIVSYSGKMKIIFFVEKKFLHMWIWDILVCSAHLTIQILTTKWLGFLDFIIMPGIRGVWETWRPEFVAWATDVRARKRQVLLVFMGFKDYRLSGNERLPLEFTWASLSPHHLHQRYSDQSFWVSVCMPWMKCQVNPISGNYLATYNQQSQPST